jgi:hypothetical protein
LLVIYRRWLDWTRLQAEHLKPHTSGSIPILHNFPNSSGDQDGRSGRYCDAGTLPAPVLVLAVVAVPVAAALAAAVAVAVAVPVTAAAVAAAAVAPALSAALSATSSLQPWAMSSDGCSEER